MKTPDTTMPRKSFFQDFNLPKCDTAIRGRIVIAGAPNVGKSVLFNRLTGAYATVSNYPGTTVEISRGVVQIDQQSFEILDTPGIYSLTPLHEDEAVSRKVLLETQPDLILHVIDAKNLEHHLVFTLQLLETGLSVALVLNMMDEARQRGIYIDTARLSQELGIPVVETVGVTGEGMKRLSKIISDSRKLFLKPEPLRHISYNGVAGFNLEEAIRELEPLLDKEEVSISRRSLALLLLKEDESISKLVGIRNPDVLRVAGRLARQLKTCRRSVPYDIGMALKREVSAIVARVYRQRSKVNFFYRFLDEATLNPWTAIPILCLVLYWGFYQFVGVFGAGTVVNFLEVRVFEEHLNPFFVKATSVLIPWKIVQDLFTGEYGVLTLGVRYAFALILPIVTFFFLLFAVVEDSGYLPRIAMMVDRCFKRIGLSGRAVIPMVLGFGCDTMATMVTRTLATVRERIIATLLLALTIPCSAQLGVILAVLKGHPVGFLIWCAVILGVFLLIGFLSAALLSGEGPSFYMEIPPLRFPTIENVLTKTWMRMSWYFQEILPLFIVASLFIWIGQMTGLFGYGIRLLMVPVRFMGLPAEAAPMFLMGFFRRDYGAAGLYRMVQSGLLNPQQIVVACVALTLFLPCVAQFLMNIRERGWKTGVVISLFTLGLSFGVACLLNWTLNFVRIPL